MRGREVKDKMGWVHHIGQCFTSYHHDLLLKRITQGTIWRMVVGRNGSSYQPISVVRVKDDDGSN